jgi:hypothetical protein
MATMPTSPAGGGAGGPQAGSGAAPGANAAPNGQQVSQVMEKFRPLADTVKQLGQQYPEGQEEAVQIMKALQQWMAKVAGNPQRTPEAQAPPNG